MDLHFYLENQFENFKLQSEMSVFYWDSWGIVKAFSWFYPQTKTTSEKKSRFSILENSLQFKSVHQKQK